jgi:heterodisulfide reductase subunit B
MAAARKLGIELIEPKGWSCCGSSPAHQTDRVLASALASVNLLLAQKMGLDLVVNCAECFSRLKKANHEVGTVSGMKEQVADVIGQAYDGTVNVRHFIEVLLEDLGEDAIKEKLTHTLAGIKVACYYGCLLVRPPGITHFDDRENPVTMDRLVTILGGQSLDWPHKVECCGGALALTRTDVVIDLTDRVIEMAKAVGADCIVVACPMCQVNLDMRQIDIRKEKGKDHQMPVLYITQLLGMCLGISQQDLGLNKLMISPASVASRINAA